MLEAVLVGGTVTAAGRLIGITRPRASERVNRPEFQQALAERRAEIKAATTEALIMATKQALDTLLGVMADKSAKDSDRVAAARVIVAATIAHPQRVEITGENGGPVEIRGRVETTQAILEDLDAAVREWEQDPAVVGGGLDLDLSHEGNGNGNGDAPE